MQTHPLRGEEICRPLPSLAPVLPLIRNHHERWDGSGYPDGLRGEEIPLLARVLQVADIYDALTSSRPYKQAYSHEEAKEIMRVETDRGWRDPAIMAVFFRVHRDIAAGIATFVGTSHRTLESLRGESLRNLRRALDHRWRAPHSQQV
jgi:putative two-component system response regulator